MPATPHYPQSPPPGDRALSELERLGLEAARILERAGSLLIHVRKSRASISDEDCSLLREARRDAEHARILCEGLLRRFGLESSP